MTTEITILRKIKNKNMIKIKACKEDKHFYFQFYEYCNGGDLLNFQEIKEKFEEREARLILK